ncbi:hypothetical protein L1987_04340 [Smallanthus sonchifolius]|uniref:Uncharacterized protein n=1 Tax=Smallanthus sonchifolius TaxID=185202 RepID=A0ACB9KD14_9ASTR|nr:hypothetical protein L1987_04340 [Smallanthus sonchifolius]
MGLRDWIMEVVKNHVGMAWTRKKGQLVDVSKWASFQFHIKVMLHEPTHQDNIDGNKLFNWATAAYRLNEIQIRDRKENEELGKQNRRLGTQGSLPAAVAAAGLPAAVDATAATGDRTTCTHRRSLARTTCNHRAPPPSNLESSSSNSKPSRIDLNELSWDPSERKPISSYHPSQKDEIRRAYLLRGPCQPTGHDFPQTDYAGFVKERFIGLVHVMDTTALSLKSAIDELFARHSLSLGRVRGQGYDGASNMSGEFNGLKALILEENSSAYYVHCFAHQLQLVVVALATKHHELYKFFKEISDLINVVGASCKRIDLIRESQRERLGLNSEVETGSGKNQEMSLARAGDTRWSSHEKTILRLLALYPSVIDVLEYIETSAEIGAHRSQANGLQIYMKTFNFIFYLHLMKHILGVTNTLCEALQRKNQDILNAVELVRSTKEELHRYRLEGFDSLLKDVTSFCDKYEIEMVNMEAEYVDPKYRRRKTGITNRHHYMVNSFNTVLDMQIQELGNRFNEVTTNLLTFMSSFSPCGNFSAFKKLNLLKLAEMYPRDFNFDEQDKLLYQLDRYIDNVKKDKRFANLNGVSDLAKMMVETNKHIDYPLVYRLIKLSLVLPVATASVERCFSSMKHVKTDLRNRMGDGYMNDSCICYIEREFFQQVSDEDVMQRFQKMKTRREQL